jgi:hypothetical protein
MPKQLTAAQVQDYANAQALRALRQSPSWRRVSAALESAQLSSDLELAQIYHGQLQDLIAQATVTIAVDSQGGNTP